MGQPPKKREKGATEQLSKGTNFVLQTILVRAKKEESPSLQMRVLGGSFLDPPEQ